MNQMKGERVTEQKYGDIIHSDRIFKKRADRERQAIRLNFEI